MYRYLYEYMDNTDALFHEPPIQYGIIRVLVSHNEITFRSCCICPYSVLYIVVIIA
jgi:hypothetical protein